MTQIDTHGDGTCTESNANTCWARSWSRVMALMCNGNILNLAQALIQDGRSHTRIRFALQKIADERTSIHQFV